MKPDPALAHENAYPWFIELQARYGDLDFYGHFNNVAIARYFEEARVRFQAAFFGEDFFSPSNPGHFRLVLAQSHIDYLAEGRYPQAVRGGVGINRTGRSSYGIDSALWQGARCIAVQRCVMVIVGDEGPLPIPDPIRPLMEARRMRVSAG